MNVSKQLDNHYEKLAAERAVDRAVPRTTGNVDTRLNLDTGKTPHNGYDEQQFVPRHITTQERFSAALKEADAILAPHLGPMQVVRAEIFKLQEAINKS